MDTTALNTTSQTSGLSLTALADEINTAHEAAETHAREAIEHALRCGRLLAEAKTQVPHGQWRPWLKANCQVKERQAQKYIRLVKRWPEIQANAHSNAHLTIDNALGLIESPRNATAAEDQGDGEYREFLEWCDEHMPNTPQDARERLWAMTPRINECAFNIVASYDIGRALGDDVGELAELFGVEEIRGSERFVKEQARRRLNALWLPELTNDKELRAAGNDSLAVISPHEQSGYYYVAVVEDFSTPTPPMQYTKRGVSRECVPKFLELCNFTPTTDWCACDFDGERPEWITTVIDRDQRDREAQ